MPDLEVGVGFSAEDAANMSNDSLYSEESGYIHYYGENFNGVSYSNILGMLNQTKQSIISKALGGLAAKNSAVAASAADTNEIEKILKGTIFDGLDMEPQQGETPGDMNVEQAMSVIGNASTEFDSVAAFMDSCYKSIENYLQTDNQALVDDYAAQLLAQYAKTNSVSGEVGSQIISQLLAQNNETFFSSFGNANNLPSHISKLLAIIAALPSATSGVSSSSKDQIVGALSSKANGWLTEMNKKSAESAMAMAVLRGNKEVLDKLSQVGIQNFQSSGSSFTIKLETPKNDFGQDEWRQALTSAIEGSKKTKKKGASYFSFSEDQLTTSFTMRELTGRRAISPKSRSWTTRVQHDTPLLTLLVRELGLGGVQMTGVMNLAAVNGGDSLEGEWNSLMDYVKYAAFLSALTEFTPPAGANYVAIGGRIWTVQDFMGAIAQGSSDVSLSTSVKGDDGLSRAPYVAMNQWTGSQRRNRYAAVRRSAMLRPRIQSKMYSTKVNVTLSLREIATLFNLAL